VQAEVDRLKTVLRLADWTVEVQDDPADDDVVASINPVYGRKLATLYLCADWDERPEGEQRHTLVHELIHCHFAVPGDMVRLDLLRHLGQATYEVFWAAFRREVEFAVDGLADAFAPLIERGIE
jgi:hypothetical protein